MLKLDKNKTINLTRHAELDSASHEILNRATLVQNDIVYQQGRSMVEMLGVLAIIGVLSVAGIAGYTTAMNQYRANETINQAMKLAVLLSSQRLTNPNATLSSTDLGENFTVGADTDKIVLALQDVSDKVSSRIQSMGFKNADVSVSGHLYL